MRGGGGFLAAWLWSRRLTEPPRPANCGFNETIMNKGCQSN